MGGNTSERNKFLVRNKEDSDLNQYWYSEHTINTIVDTVCEHLDKAPFEKRRVAFLSTPSIYFSMPERYLPYCTLLDYDPKFERSINKLNIEPGDIPKFILYDFNFSTMRIPEQTRNRYTMFVIDPPFITRDVWEKYTETVNFMGSNSPKSHILCSTIAENENMMQELMCLSPVVFQPNIPNLVYLYTFYSNFDSEHLSVKNKELLMEG